MMTRRQLKRIGDVLLTVRQIMQSHISKEDVSGQRLIQKVLRLELDVARFHKKSEGREKRIGA
jgi:hypothetical protein